MAIFSDKKERRSSTVVRDNMVHAAYRETVEELGDIAPFVAKSYIYERIRARTGLCTKTIAYILNHTRERPESFSGGGKMLTLSILRLYVKGRIKGRMKISFLFW